MKIVQIKNDNTMVDCDETFTTKNIRKIMRELSGVRKIDKLYEWTYEDGVIQCYGCIQGKPGSENKHDLPTSGKKIIDTLDNSDVQLLFNDIFLVRMEQSKYVDFDISDYGLFYTLCFEGFDDCNSDDDLITSDEDIGSLDSFIVQDDIDDENDEGETDSDGSYELPEVESDDELEEDIHDY